MKKGILFFIGLVCLLLAIANIVVWIVISAQSEKSFEAVVAEYVGLFPALLANPITLTFLNILLLSIAILCFVYSKARSNQALFKKTCVVLIIFSGILAFWNLFSLM
jgi:hypothetical protein